jgi:predicted nucleic acid-binding protein
MNVIVDTSVWSLALRRDSPRGTPQEIELTELISEGRVLMLGAVRQELLSGVRGADQFRTLRNGLRAFPDVALEEADYEEAASCFNRCRSRGIQGSNTDFLLCSVALRRGAAILTTDKDFARFARVLHFHLHAIRA